MLISNKMFNIAGTPSDTGLSKATIPNIMCWGLSHYMSELCEQTCDRFDAICCFTPLSRVYDTPIRAGRANVLGIQGQLWSESRGSRPTIFGF